MAYSIYTAFSPGRVFTYPAATTGCPSFATIASYLNTGGAPSGGPSAYYATYYGGGCWPVRYSYPPYHIPRYWYYCNDDTGASYDRPYYSARFYAYFNLPPYGAYLGLAYGVGYHGNYWC